MEHKEDDMPRTWCLAIGILSLGLWLGGSPSWGGPPNPTPSDADRNTAGGSHALEENTAGYGNTAFGHDALRHNTRGDRNTASGHGALSSNTTGDRNTASGHGALRNMTEGLSNIAIGASAGSTLHHGDYNIYLGHEGQARDESHTMRLGQHQTRTFIAGITAPVRGTAVLITAVSDARRPGGGRVGAVSGGHSAAAQ
jgi:hypothetical protein